MKYRKIPVVIDAEKIKPNEPLPSHVYMNSEGKLCIDTLEGIMHPWFGDYRIIGVDGEAYSCRADIFDRTYEAAE